MARIRTAAELARALGGRRSGSGWMACCPAHEDRHPSLAINDGPAGELLFYCHAGCSQAQVLSALREAGIVLESEPAARIVATYDYRDATDALLYQVVRFEPKDFRQRRPDGQGGWIWNLEGVRRVLYRLPELLTADARDPVFVVEGEKDADRLRELGLVATTNPGGAGKWQAAYNALLAGRDVTILPDNDEAGRNHASDVARSLRESARSVRIVELPGLPPKGDISDWLAGGGTREQLLDRTGATRPLGPEDLSPRGEDRHTSVGFRPVDQYLQEAGARAAKKAYWAGILREGEISMLVGRAYAGKSTFACALTRALTLGEPLLGRECFRATVGYMALERNGNAVARQLEKWELASSVHFLAEIPAMRPDDLAELLHAEIVRLGLNVVIVDHLQNLIRVRDSNDYAAVSLALQPFQRVARKTGAHILLLHHQGKTERGGVIDVMGSEAYRASADALLEAKADDDRYFIRAEVRGEGDLPKTKVKVDFETGEVEHLDAAEAEVADAMHKIVAFLEGQREPLPIDAIQAGVGLRRVVVSNALRDGCAKGTLTRTGLGKRYAPFLYELRAWGSDDGSGTAGTETRNARKPNEHKGLFGSRGSGNGNMEEWPGKLPHSDRSETVIPEKPPAPSSPDKELSAVTARVRGFFPGARLLVGAGASDSNSRGLRDGAEPGTCAPTNRGTSCKLSPEVTAEISRIESEALAAGWSREELWNYSFWPHTSEHQRGLAAVMEPGDRIVEVTPDWIAIEKSNQGHTRCRFYRAEGRPNQIQRPRSI